MALPYMKKFFKHITTDSFLAWGFIVSILCLLLALGVFLFFYHLLPPFLPLYNKLPWGYARIGTKLEMFIPIGLMCGIFILNLFLSNFLYKKVALLARIVCATTTITSLALCVYVIQVVLLIQ